MRIKNIKTSASIFCVSSRRRYYIARETNDNGINDIFGRTNDNVSHKEKKEGIWRTFWKERKLLRWKWKSICRTGEQHWEIKVWARSAAPFCYFESMTRDKKLVSELEFIVWAKVRIEHKGMRSSARIADIGLFIKSCPIKLKTKCKKKWRWSCRLMKTWHTYNNNIVNIIAKKLIQNLHFYSRYGIFYV